MSSSSVLTCCSDDNSVEGSARPADTLRLLSTRRNKSVVDLIYLNLFGKRLGGQMDGVGEI